MPTTQTSQVDPASHSLLSIEQLADWLGVTDRFIRRLVAERRIPFLKIGEFIRFDPPRSSHGSTRSASPDDEPRLAKPVTALSSGATGSATPKPAICANSYRQATGVDGS